MGYRLYTHIMDSDLRDLHLMRVSTSLYVSTFRICIECFHIGKVDSDDIAQPIWPTLAAQTVCLAIAAVLEFPSHAEKHLVALQLRSYKLSYRLTV
ncbi:hypothetical protein DPMN_188145 [Dreissena polymorpha]|uniref:Uncharacterized protein n=1 Tax=Dreissena polymorpha TaxID=45954 RepID=A0A9D4I875_DREPO|nr:hypothetical protein DPMN_188145 [Dreissena polymorpha]